MRIRDHLTISRKNFFRHGYKTIGPIIMIAIAITLYILIASFVTSAQGGINENLIENDNLKFIEVTQKDGEVLTYADTEQFYSVEGVKLAFPKELTVVMLEEDELGDHTSLIGIPNEVIPYFTGADLEFKNKNDLIIQNDFEYLPPVPEGESVNIEYTVMMREGHGTVQTTEAVVIGTLEEDVELFGYNGNFSLAPLEFVKELNAKFFNMTTEEYVNTYSPESITVIVEDIDQIVAVSKAIEEKGYVTNYSLRAAQGLPMFANLIMYVGGIVVLILLIFAGVSISSILQQSFRSRYKEIGIMRAIGFDKKHIVRILLTEVFFMCMIAFIIAVGVSAVILFIINGLISNQADEAMVRLTTSAPQIGIALLLSTLVGLIASLSKIRGAVKMKPVEYLGRE